MNALLSRPQDVAAFDPPPEAGTAGQTEREAGTRRILETLWAAYPHGYPVPDIPEEPLTDGDALRAIRRANALAGR